MTQEEAGSRLDKTRSTMHRIEIGETRADVHLIRSMMDLYGARDDELLDLAREAAKPGWWHHYGLKDLGYVDMETEADTVCEFAALNIPGLLQTDAYMRAHFQDGPSRSKAEINNQITVRAIRGQRLTDEDHPLTLHAIIDEAALSRPVGGAEVMAEQLRHLAQAAELDGVTIQVLPFDAGKHDSMAGGFSLLTFPEPEDADVLYVEYRTGAMHIEKIEEVRAATLAFARLRCQALSPADSVALILRLVAERYGVR